MRLILCRGDAESSGVALAGTITQVALEGASWLIGRRHGRLQELEYDLDYWRNRVDRAQEEVRQVKEERDQAQEASRQLLAQVQELNEKLHEVCEAYEELERRARRAKHRWKGLSWWRRLLRR